jgi:hypothetical protein
LIFLFLSASTISSSSDERINTSESSIDYI